MIYTNTGRQRAKTRALNKKLDLALCAKDMAEVELEETRNKLTAEIESQEAVITNLRDDAAHASQQIAALTKQNEDLSASVTSFKEEMLGAQLQVAEMRGYIARVLEDDHVREVGPMKATPQSMPDGERHALIKALGEDDRARCEPTRPVRKGPGGMAPFLIVDNAAGEYDPFGQHGYHLSRASEVKRPKHWTAR